MAIEIRNGLLSLPAPTTVKQAIEYFDHGRGLNIGKIDDTKFDEFANQVFGDNSLIGRIRRFSRQIINGAIQIPEPYVSKELQLPENHRDRLGLHIIPPII